MCVLLLAFTCSKMCCHAKKKWLANLIMSSSYLEARPWEGTGRVGLRSCLSNNAVNVPKTSEPTLRGVSSPPIASPTPFVHTGYLCAFIPRKPASLSLLKCCPGWLKFNLPTLGELRVPGNLTSPRGSTYPMLEGHEGTNMSAPLSPDGDNSEEVPILLQISPIESSQSDWL